MLAGSIMLWAVTDVFFGTLWNVMWRNVWRSYKHIEDKEVHTVRTFCTKDPKGTKGEECWRSVGRFWRPTRKWHKLTHIYKYVVKYCPGVVSLWDVGLRDNPARCAVLINKFQYFDFWSLLLFLNTQDNLKSNTSLCLSPDSASGGLMFNLFSGFLLQRLWLTFISLVFLWSHFSTAILTNSKPVYSDNKVSVFIFFMELLIFRADDYDMKCGEVAALWLESRTRASSILSRNCRWGEWM